MESHGRCRSCTYWNGNIHRTKRLCSRCGPICKHCIQNRQHQQYARMMEISLNPKRCRLYSEVMRFLRSFSDEFDWSVFTGVQGSHLIRLTEQQLINIMSEARKGLAIALFNTLHLETSKIFLLHTHTHTCTHTHTPPTQCIVDTM